MDTFRPREAIESSGQGVTLSRDVQPAVGSEPEQGEQQDSLGHHTQGL